MISLISVIESIICRTNAKDLLLKYIANTYHLDEHVRLREEVDIITPLFCCSFKVII